MGYSNWSDAAFQSRQSYRTQTKQSAFTYDQQVRSTGIARVHPEMDPRGVTRESRDSDKHPTSVAISVLFDVTGSMGTVPRVLQTKLGSLMRLLIRKGYVEDPQLLFGAVGDAYTDIVPLQIGQFESGLEMDDDLGKIYLEGAGGGQVYESYELAMYFCATHLSMDCYEKRGKKGYLFTIGDEKPYMMIRRDQAHTHIGDTLEADLPIETVIESLHERFEHFHIIPTNTSHGASAAVQDAWRTLMGERVLILADEEAVCETIALAIGLCEGTVDDLYQGTGDLIQAGYDPKAARNASTAVATYAATRSPVARLAYGTLSPVSMGDSGDEGRL